MKYLMSVYLNIVLPLLGYKISNVGLFYHYWDIKYLNVGIFKDRFIIIGL